MKTAAGRRDKVPLHLYQCRQQDEVINGFCDPNPAVKQREREVKQMEYLLAIEG